MLYRCFKHPITFCFVSISYLNELNLILWETFFLQLLQLTSLTSLILRELEYHDFMRLRRIIRKIWNHLLSSQILCSDLRTGKVKPADVWREVLTRSQGCVIDPCEAEQYWGESRVITCTSKHYFGLEQLCIPQRPSACRGLCNWLYLSVRSLNPVSTRAVCCSHQAVPLRPPSPGPCRDGRRECGIPVWEQNRTVPLQPKSCALKGLELGKEMGGTLWSHGPFVALDYPDMAERKLWLTLSKG